MEEAVDGFEVADEADGGQGGEANEGGGSEDTIGLCRIGILEHVNDLGGEEIVGEPPLEFAQSGDCCGGERSTSGYKQA